MNKPFYNQDLFGNEIERKSTGTKKSKKQYTCEECGLYKSCESPKMQLTGKGKQKILIIAEAPGEQEDLRGIQLVGPSGRLLRNTLSQLGYDLDEDFWKTNAVTCFVSSKICVYTSNGYKQIKDIKIGDLVLTHKGRFRKVISRMHDLPIESRKNIEKLVNIRIKNKKYTVTFNHKILNEKDKWISAGKLKKGDKIKVLGEKCIICGNIYFKSPTVFDKAESTCSQRCHNISASKKSGKAISKSMKKQYKNGIRDRNKITRKANEKVRKLVEENKWNPFKYVNREKYFKGRIKYSQDKQRHNCLYKGSIVGFGERELGEWFKDRDIEFYHQFSIKSKNFDFYLPKYNLLIEVEYKGQFRKKCKKRIEIAKLNNKEIVFISSNNPIEEIKRILKNHNSQYYFLTIEILSVEIYEQKTQKYLYCIEVEEDNSFIAGGIIHHNCKPPKNRTPKNTEIQACRKNLLANIEKVKPCGVILLGKIAFDALVSYRFAGRIQDVGFRDMVGCCIPDQELGFWVFPIYHPAFLLRKENDVLLKNEWRRQLKKAIRITKEKTFYKHNYDTDIFVHKDVKEAIECIKKVRRETEIISFDYETTGLKPHRKGHRIVCIGISDGLFGYAFPNFDDAEFQHEFRRLLTNKNIGKIAHNIRFEEQWTRNILGYEVNNWYWDSEIGYRFLYNRRKSKLKFGAYVDFGILGMDETVDKYIRGIKSGEDKKDANHFNRVDEAPFDDLLKYCGLDALMSYKMYELQNIKMRENRKGFCLLKNGQISLLQSTEDGVCVDEKLLDNTIERTTKKIEKYKKQIYESDVLKKWDGEEQFNQKSSTQLSHLLYDILKLECPKLTAKGGRSVDVEALQILDHPFCDNILNYRKWLKVRDTYLYQYKREIVDGLLHINFNLNRAKTHRSSSDSPNLQNVPKRDKEIKKQIRSIIIPRDGNRLGEDDYKAIEVCVASCYTKDRNLLKYVRDKSTDMHRDMACQIFFRNKETFLKEERHDAKNGYVFPSFYGSWYEQTAPDLWERAKERPETTFQNLKNNGIRNYDDFENHIRIIEDDFWHNRFPEYNEWKEKTYHDYCKRGYMDSLTGFRYSGYMKKNEVLNYMIQGSAFHCLLWTYNSISPYIKKLKYSFLIGQIHDAILRDFHPNDESYIDNLIIEYGTKKIREYWDWIIVPLTMEKEVSEINGNWAEMKEVEYLKEIV